MPLKARGDCVYYYENRRVGHRVVSKYVASGLLAILADELDEDTRQHRQARQEAERQALAAWQVTDDAERAQVRAVVLAARQLAQDHLTALGFHRDPRRRWRLKMTTATATDPSAPTEAPAPPPAPLKRGHPDAASLPVSHSQGLGPNVGVARNLVAHWPPEQKWRVLDDLDAFVMRLAGSSPSGAVLALAESAGLTWMRLRSLETFDVIAEPKGGRTVQRMALDQKRIAQERRQLADLIETIARVRRLESRAPLTSTNILVTGPTMIGASPAPAALDGSA